MSRLNQRQILEILNDIAEDESEGPASDPDDPSSDSEDSFHPQI